MAGVGYMVLVVLFCLLTKGNPRQRCRAIVWVSACHLLSPIALDVLVMARVVGYWFLCETVYHFMIGLLGWGNVHGKP